MPRDSEMEVSNFPVTEQTPKTPDRLSCSERDASRLIALSTTTLVMKMRKRRETTKIREIKNIEI